MILLLKRHFNKHLEKKSKIEITAASFSLLVRGIPNTVIDATVLGNHFEDYGKVHSAILLYSSNGIKKFSKSGSVKIEDYMRMQRQINEYVIALRKA